MTTPLHNRYTTPEQPDQKPPLPPSTPHQPLASASGELKRELEPYPITPPTSPIKRRRRSVAKKEESDEEAEEEDAGPTPRKVRGKRAPVGALALSDEDYSDSEEQVGSQSHPTLKKARKPRTPRASGSGSTAKSTPRNRKAAPAPSPPPLPGAEARLADLGPKVVPPPAGVTGKVVVWPSNISLISTTEAKRVYKISDAYLTCLDREARKSSDGLHDLFLYSEKQVQASAIDQRGGLEYFRVYLKKLNGSQRLRVQTANKRLLEAGKKAKPVPPPLSDHRPPIALVSDRVYYHTPIEPRKGSLMYHGFDEDDDGDYDEDEPFCHY